MSLENGDKGNTVSHGIVGQALLLLKSIVPVMANGSSEQCLCCPLEPLIVFLLCIPAKNNCQSVG